MIADLKNDSARWDAERRRQHPGPGAGAGTPDSFSHEWVDNRVHNPNSPPVRYQDSHIRDFPQRSIGGGSNSYQQPYGGNSREYDSGQIYPGSEAPDYSASAGSGPGQYGASSGPGGYGGGGVSQYPQGVPPQSYTLPQPGAAQEPRYSGPPPPMPGLASSYNPGNPAASVNVPLSQEGYSGKVLYAVAQPSDSYSMDMQMSDAPMAPTRRTSPPGAPVTFGNPGNSRPGYGGGPTPPTSGFGAYGPPPGTGLGSGPSFAQAVDSGYGRGEFSSAPPTLRTQLLSTLLTCPASTTSSSGFSPVHEMPPHGQQAQQYEDLAQPPSPLRTGTLAANTQAQLPSNSGQQTGLRRDRDRAVSERSDTRDRDRNDRPLGRDRERDRDSTPPNRNVVNVPPPATGASSHHLYGRR